MKNKLLQLDQHVLFFLSLSLLVCLATGCATTNTAPDPALRAAGQQLFAPIAGPATATSRPPAWRIVLVTFSGDNAPARAQSALPIIQQRGGVPEAFVEPRKDGVIIALGAYNKPTDADAQKDLQRIRAIKVDGRPAYPQAFLTPPPVGVDGANPAWNLAHAKEQYGQSIQYTLQVAVYESDNLIESMRLAEKAVATYRNDGELAFYYFGANMSMVTIGVFTRDDFDPATNHTSGELATLMKKHPHHLYNGMGIKEHLIDGSTHMQPTRLVRIP